MGNFKFIKTQINDMFIVEPQIFGDNRGYFLETYHFDEFKKAGINVNFVQDNQSKSSRGVLRGLHFQTKRPQGKLVRVIQGEVFDVGVDLRKNSPTFGKWVGVTLSSENKRQLFIPAGFAHGFLVISDTAEFVYKCTDFYDPENEGGIIYNDSDINIKWPIDKNMNIILSKKDSSLPSFKEFLKYKGV